MPMGPDTTKPPSNMLSEANAAVQLRPELLLAARLGDWERLDDLLNKEDVPAVILVPEVVADIEEADTAVTIEEVDAVVGSTLHVVASSGDGDKFLKSATMIYDKAKHLMDARNRKGDTPLHCAARAGRVKMVSHLIALARGEDGGDARVKAVLRKQNAQGETALNEALRLANKETVKKMVDVLISADVELARFPHANGTSPLYLAVLLGHDDIAVQLHEKDNQLSYSGPEPDGQNVLHVAVLRSIEMTKKLLQWNKDLTKQGDRSSGSTPLHFAASWGINEVTTGRTGSMYRLLVCETAMLILDADKSSAYQCDNKGLFPIHVAALGNNAHVVRLLLKKCPDCAELRDAQGSTFLHNAVVKKNYFVVLLVSWILRGNRLLVKDTCQEQRFASIINMQDNEGNTGLHLAVQAGELLTFCCLLWNKEVQLNLTNNKGQTALDLSWSKKPTGIRFVLDPQVMIFDLLNLAGAKPGIYRCDRFEVPTLNETEEAKKISDSAPTLGIASVLIVTVAFAAAFAIPGGYRADDHRNGGTPTLATSPVFESFIIANNLALLCSSLATISLMFAGVTTVDIPTRKKAFVSSIFLLNSSARSMVAAFAFGLNAVLTPVARRIAITTWVMMALTLLDIVWSVGTIALGQLVLLNRLGVRACFLFAGRIICTSLDHLWPYVVIAGFLAHSKIHGMH